MKLHSILTGAAIAVAFSAPVANAGTIVKQSGSTNPGTIGFTNNVGGPVYGSPVKRAWNMQGSECCDYNQFVISDSDVTKLGRKPWTLTTVMQNLSTNSGDGTSIYAIVITNGTTGERFDISLQSDGLGNQILSDRYYCGSDCGPGTQSYLISGLGTNYVTITMTFNPATNTVNYYVNGTLAIANDPPWTDTGYGAIVAFGGVDGNFQLVQLKS